MDMVFVKPAEGGRIRQPERGGRVMPAAGDRVVRDGYYARLILTGDVVVADPPAEGAVEQPPPSPAPPPNRL